MYLLMFKVKHCQKIKILQVQRAKSTFMEISKCSEICKHISEQQKYESNSLLKHGFEHWS